MNRSTTREQEVDDFLLDFERRVHFTIARDMASTLPTDRFAALAYAVRDELVDKWLKTQLTYYKQNPKRVYYLSLEFLMGRTLGNALMNLGKTEVAVAAMEKLKAKLKATGTLERLGHIEGVNELEELEHDAGLGNGGLGRLAACFLDSMATMNLPAYGYGIRYEYGMFEQRIQRHCQVEAADNWLAKGSPWEIPRFEVRDEFEVPFKGVVTAAPGAMPSDPHEWHPAEKVVAVCYDVPVPGYDTETVNSLKLWSAKSSTDFNLENFNAGDYTGAIEEKHASEVISKVLYPNDQNIEGKELRLKQQYFMVAASLRDILSRLERCDDPIQALPEKAVIQLNDTHPSIAIVELMRILVDERRLPWVEAWKITKATFAYTNHTVLPEALERWSVPMMEYILPRHMQLIYEINQHFLDEVSCLFPGDWERRERISIIEEAVPKQVRMANLAIVGSFSVNGVAQLHSELLTTGIFKDFYELWPNKFNNKTNGITPRRWLRYANPELSDLISQTLKSDAWIKDLSCLKGLEKFAQDPAFHEKWQAVKQQGKQKLAEIIYHESHLRVDLNSIFDVQVKRIHEYKRQLLNLLHVIYLYNRIKRGELENFVPRTVIFAGKAAPGYHMAKEIISLISHVAHQISHNLKIHNHLEVVFLPNYGVSLAEHIFPGSDLSEQISTAGMEASGTGNMKFALNGALTIGTLDGANVEMQEEVGSENIFIFGLTATEVMELKAKGYNPREYYESIPALKEVLDQIASGYFNPNDPQRFAGIVHRLLDEGDPFCVLADFQAYIDCQEKVSATYQDQKAWTEMSILNVARMGKFSSDRTIDQYAKEIWQVNPCKVDE